MEKMWTTKELCATFGLEYWRVAQMLKNNPSQFTGVVKGKFNKKSCYQIPNSQIDKLMGMKAKGGKQ